MLQVQTQVNQDTLSMVQQATEAIRLMYGLDGKKIKNSQEALAALDRVKTILESGSKYSAS